jgi:NitT/TauT family transport system substrate-binding protein
MSAIVYRDEGSIKSPKDLEGKRIAAPVGDGNRVIFPAFAKLAGIDASKVKWVTVEGQSKAPLLLNKQIDATVFFDYHAPRLARQASQLGITLKWFPYSDYGVSLYASGLLANDKTIQERPKMLSSFVQATLKGMRWAKQNRDEAARIIVKYAAEVVAQDAKAEWEVTEKYIFVKEAEEAGLGRYDPKILKQTIKTVHELMNTKRRPSPKEVATSQFAKGN